MFWVTVACGLICPEDGAVYQVNILMDTISQLKGFSGRIEGGNCLDKVTQIYQAILNSKNKKEAFQTCVFRFTNVR